MAKKKSERHTFFISTVFTPSEGRRVEIAARKAHMKKSAWLRHTALEKLDAAKVDIK